MLDLVTQLDVACPLGLDDLGGPWDTAVSNAMREFGELGRASKSLVRDEIDGDRSWILMGWAERAASLAVRQQDAEALLYGLVGLSLVNLAQIDERDVMVLLPLFVRAAQMLSTDPDDTFRKAEALADTQGSVWLAQFVPTEPYGSLMIHTERGFGPTFAFVRKEVAWDPLTTLAPWMDENQ
jgi:hypothetical protein